MASVPYGNHVTKAVTLSASAARTATFQGSATGTAIRTLAITGAAIGTTRHALVFLDVTASSGTTPTLDVVVEGRVSGSGTWTALPGGRFAQKITTGTECIRLEGPLPVDIRINATIAGTTPSFTMSVTAVLGG